MHTAPLLQLVLADSHIYYIVIAGHGRRVHEIPYSSMLVSIYALQFT